MSIVDKLLGRKEATQQQQTRRQVEDQPLTGRSSDEQAVARYRYMLQTAPPLRRPCCGCAAPRPLKKPRKTSRPSPKRSINGPSGPRGPKVSMT